MLRFNLGLVAGAALLLAGLPSSVLAHGKTTTAIKEPRFGQWFLDPESDAGRPLSLSLRQGDENHWHGGSEHVSLQDLEGLTAADLEGAGHPVSFRVRRDAGTIECRGSMERGRGAGTFEIVLEPDFVAGLKKRGIGAPTEAQQARLVIANAGFGLLDELKRQKYETPDVQGLLRLADHGVSLEYVRGMGVLGFELESLDQLVKARDHGVDPGYVKSLADAGFKNLPFEEVLRARDHGADSDFIAYFHKLGYKDLSLDQLIRLRDHGVDDEYVEGMRALGYRNASLNQLVTARDHGVDPQYVSGMARAGIKNVPLENLIRARDHGVDPAFARKVRAQNSSAGLNEMIYRRDHGID